MPNITDFLSGVFSGATHPKGTMGDFQHAARLYTDNLYALTPKAGWMYYAYFVINPKAQTAISAGADKTSSSLLGTIGQVLGGANVKGIISNGKNQNLEAGMLVKAADLPKFQIQTENKSFCCFDKRRTRVCSTRWSHWANGLESRSRINNSISRSKCGRKTISQSMGKLCSYRIIRYINDWWT